MKTVTISIATTPAGVRPVRAHQDQVHNLLNEMQRTAKDVGVDVFTAATGFGADELDGMSEPCATIVVGVNDAQTMVDLKTAMLRIAKVYKQRSIAWVVGDTDILSTGVER